MPGFRGRCPARYETRIREVRRAKGFETMREFVAHLKYFSEPEVSRWETNEVMPSLDSAAYIAERLGCRIDDLVVRARKFGR